jgi:hypothetical protein
VAQSVCSHTAFRAAQSLVATRARKKTRGAAAREVRPR